MNDNESPGAATLCLEGTAAPTLIQLLLDTLPAGALLVDACGQIIFVNQLAERFLGWPAAHLVGQPVHEWLHCYLEGLGRVPENCPVGRVLKGESGISIERIGLRCRGEQIKPFEYRCTAYPTGSGVGAVLAFNEITRQLAIEKDLRSLASVAEASPIAIVELNQDANLIHANPTMMSLMDRFGFGTGLRAAVLPERIEELTAECLSKQAEIGAIEVCVGDHCYEWKLVPEAGERMVHGYGVDHTARKRMELALARAKIEAEAANRAKSEFFAKLNHELRTPVKEVLAVAARLAGSQLDNMQRDCAATIQTCAETLLRIVDNIRAAAEFEAGQTK